MGERSSNMRRRPPTTSWTDSFASGYQSRVYGAYIPEDSLFATYQSYGALPMDEYPGEEEVPSTGWGWGLFIVRWTSLLLAARRLMG